jgi:hypothetical protein
LFPLYGISYSVKTNFLHEQTLMRVLARVGKTTPSFHNCGIRHTFITCTHFDNLGYEVPDKEETFPIVREV